MSKSLKQVNQERQVFSIIQPILQKQLERQDEQGKALRSMYEGITAMYGEITENMAEMRQMVQEVRDSTTLTDTECYDLQSAVATKSIQLTKDRIHEEEADFPKIVGKYRWMIWKHLKRRYHVPKYNHIRRIDHMGALSFVQGFRPEDYI
ncbi:ORF6C domain-containing protein [Gorillibacterium sp. CAU 1737]|uniref:ORF6C domain-containing protein n=1 Tax=Gorillibacterium sp. CAU 1737 TaxID=3140362 RepID=UPI003260546E